MKLIEIRIFALLFTLGLFAACGEEPPPPPPPDHQFTIEVRVDDENENPLARVPVLLDGKTVGLTDADGKFSGTLTEKAGAPITLAVGEVEGYKFPTGQTTEITETLRLTKVNNQDSGIPVFLRVRAESLRKDFLVWVKAKCDKTLEDGCEDLPVTLNGEEVARTNEFGYAHFSFSDVPQNEVSIVIDTPSHNPGDAESLLFEPRDPTYKLALDLSSHVYVVEQSFTDPQAEAKKKPKKRSTRRTKRQKRTSSAKKKAQTPKAEKPKDPGGIDLWN